MDGKLCGLQSWCGRLGEKSVAHDENRITNDSSAVQAVISLLTTLYRLYEIQRCLNLEIDFDLFFVCFICALSYLAN